jgi:hypothetical protein
MDPMKALIAAKSPRRKIWRYVFGTDSVEIRSIAWRTSPQGKRCYQLDVTALNLRQRSMLIRCMSELWKIPVDQVDERLDDPNRGAWIDAEDVEISMDTGRLF